MSGGRSMSKMSKVYKTIECPRCRKRYIVTPETMKFHLSCEVTSWGPIWRR